MTIRTDLTIDWQSSPRVIEVASPSTEITIQDLHDTCKYFEDNVEGLLHPYLVSSGGKEFLGGTTYVGITATLQNAVLAFEARSGPSWELCVIAGGNLVAVDDVGGVIDPRMPTAYTTIDRTASASATLQEQDALQHSSFNGGVTVDFTSSHTGTEFPVGTSMAPVNNWTDAKAIASDRGFYTVYLLGDATIDDTETWSDFHFVGASREKSSITIDNDADVNNCEYYDATVNGWLDGNSVIRECRITNINYIQGTIDRCILEGSQVTLLGDAVFLDCYSGNPELGTPEVDCNGSGKALILKNFNGKITLKNKTGSEPVDIDLNSGEIVIENTVTAGSITIRGVGDYDNSGTATLIVDDLVNPTNIGSHVWSDNKGKLVHDVEGGRWKVVNNQMIFYESDNLTEVAIFDLFDSSGNPTMTNVYERRRVIATTTTTV